MILRLLCFCSVSLFITGCNSTFKSNDLPDTIAEGYVKASYVPLDGLPIFTSHGARSCGTKGEEGETSSGEKREWKELLDALPDQTIRMTVGQYTDSGTLSFGPIVVGKRGAQYQVVLDYINNDAINIPLLITPESGSKSVYTDINADTRFSVTRLKGDKSIILPENSLSNIINVTVYVGIGLRMTAQITTNKADVNLSSLSALTAAAEKNAISGNLTVQTIGITGPSVSSSLPLPSDLTKESIQATILALGGVKSSIYDIQHTTKTARVVGIYIPIGGNELLVDGIRNALASKPVEWHRPCKALGSDSL
jgi:hypothetical protein